MALALAGCPTSDQKVSPAIAEAAAHRVAFDGCVVVRLGPTCEVTDGQPVYLWMPAVRGLRVAVRINNVDVQTRPQEVQGGWRYRLDLGVDARSVSVRFGGFGPAFVLRVQPHRRHPTLTAVRALFPAQPDEILRRLDASAPDFNPVDRARATALRARVALSRGDHTQAIVLLERAATQAEQLGLVSEVVRQHLARAHTLIVSMFRFDEAQDALDAATAIAADQAPGSHVRIGYYRGLLAYNTGDLRGALRALTTAEHAAERLGVDAYRHAVQQPLAEVLQSLGRTEEAVDRLQASVDRDGPTLRPCARAILLSNLGWMMLLKDRGVSPPPRSVGRTASADRPLREALALFSTECPRPRSAAAVLANLAWLALADGHPAHASRWVAQSKARASEPDVHLVATWTELAGHIAEAKGDLPEALAHYRRLATIAAASPDTQFRAASAQGRVGMALVARGVTSAAKTAETAYRRAEALLDRQSLRVPLGAGRVSFLGDRSQSARALVELLVEQRRPRDAFDAAQRSLARVVSSLDRGWLLSRLDVPARSRWRRALGQYRKAKDTLDRKAAQDWRLPAAEFAQVSRQRAAERAELDAQLEAALSVAVPPPPLAVDKETLVLLYHPTRRGWAAFAANINGIEAVNIGPIAPDSSPAELTERLLKPFEHRIEQAPRLRILTDDVLSGIDFHALQWRNEQPLIDRKVVVYGLGRVSSTRSPRPRTAMIVADPLGNLPAARREAAAVERALRPSGHAMTRLTGNAATTVRVRQQLAEHRLFHYAGHGWLAGPDGWQSALQLANGPLTVGDILALPAVPRSVVLSGCHTAGATTARAQTLGVAQAFVAAGAEVAIAARRPVRDELARAMSVALYRHAAMDSESGENPAAPDDATDWADWADWVDWAEALRKAQLDIRRADPASDWAAFRALVP